MVEDSQRPRPALPPGAERPQWHHRPLAPGELRRIPHLVRDTFALIGRRWRSMGEYALIGAAGYLVAFVMLFLGLNALFGGQFFTMIDELSDPLGDSQPDYRTWLESYDVTPTATAIALLVAFGLVSLIGYFVQEIAATHTALDDVEGREISASRALAVAFRRLPKVFAMVVVLGAVACAGCVLLYRVHSAFAILWGLTLLPLLVVFGPLLPVYFVMAYLTPGMPSPRRWMRLMRGRKAAIWGRVVLIIIAVQVVSIAISASLGPMPLPDLYGDLIINLVVTPLTFVFTAVAYLLIYADLVTREESAPAEVESPS